MGSSMDTLKVPRVPELGHDPGLQTHRGVQEEIRRSHERRGSSQDG